MQAEEMQPPHDTDAEDSVLGACLIDPEAFPVIADRLRGEDFYHPRNRVIFAAMAALHGRDVPIDSTILFSELGEDGIVKAGGYQAVVRLLTVVPTAIHVDHYAGIVAVKAAQRRLISASGRIAAWAYAGDADLPELFKKAADAIYTAEGPSAKSTVGPVHISDVLAGYLETLNVGSMPAIGGQSGGRVPTGFFDLDRLLGGMQRSDLVILAARPSVGKSALSLNIACHSAVRHESRVLFYSAEMSRVQVAQRCLSAETGIDSTRLREGRLNGDEIKILNKGLTKLSGACVWIDAEPSISLSALQTRARRHASDYGLDLVIVDYLQLVRGRQTSNRVQEVSEVTAGLKQLARELEVPVLALSQLSREIEHRADHKPQLSDLRDSGSIEQDADVVMFLAKNEELPGIVDLLIAKHRNGPVGDLRLTWDASATRFGDMAAHGFGLMVEDEYP